MKLLSRVCVLLAGLIGLFDSSVAALGQMPSQCDQLEAVLDQYKAAHESCLSSHSGEKEVQETSEICSHPSCQQFHSYVYGSKGQELISQIAACRHAEQYAQAVANEQRQADSDRVAMYGNMAADANQLTDQYNNQAAAIQPYAMSDDTSQDIDAMHRDADSMAAASNNSGTSLTNNSVIDANSYASSPAPDQGLSDVEHAAIRQVADEGIQEAFGKEVYDSYKEVKEVYNDVNDIRSDDPQKSIDGTFDLAEKWNDNYNPNPISRYVNQIALPTLHNFDHNLMGLLNSAMQRSSCIFDMHSTCAGESEQLNREIDHFLAHPFSKPLNSPSDLFSQ